MDCCHYITDLPERKSGQHLQREERGAIQALKRQGLSNRAIARESAPFPETAQTAFLRSIRILGCCPGQRAQVVSGCLRRLRKTPRTDSGQRDGLYPHALS